MSEEDKSPEGIRKALFSQLKRARAGDFNPWRRVWGNELLSVRGAEAPLASRLRTEALRLDGDGWVSADFLEQAALLAERSGSGLIEPQPASGELFLLGLLPEADIEAAARLRGRGKKGQVNLCPLWGPCLGERADWLEPLLALEETVGPELEEGLTLSLAACGRDCRGLCAEADLFAFAEDNGESFALWLGGRRRMFGKTILPRPWRPFPADGPEELTAFVLQAQSAFLANRRGGETLPELADRLTESEFREMFGG
jgi:hypothetical protein